MPPRALDPAGVALVDKPSGPSSELNKRYITEIDLTCRTSTGDPEGEVVASEAPPSEDELGERLERLRGEIELPIPAASAVKIGGERAYRLARRGVEVEMPLRRSTVHALDVIAYTGERVTLEALVSSGTYVRALAIALGGHCATLRRTEVGPFSVDDAVAPEAFTAERLRSEADVLAEVEAARLGPGT